MDSTSLLIVLIGLAVFLLLVLLVMLVRTMRRPPVREVVTLPYKKQGYILTRAERSFFGVLENAIGNEFYIFPKIRLLDLFRIPPGTHNANGYRARVISRHVDFVICDRRQIEPLLVVELDDSSHQRAKQQKRDAFVDAACDAAGLPILRHPVRRSYAVEELRRQVLDMIGRTHEEVRPDCHGTDC